MNYEEVRDLLMTLNFILSMSVASRNITSSKNERTALDVLG